jgi:two-component system response regulator AtoC
VESSVKDALPRRRFEPEFRGDMPDLATNGIVDQHPPIVLEEPAMKALYEIVERVAQGTINVVLRGETGAGKNVFAEMFHRLSPRRHAPYLRIACDSLAEAWPGEDYTTHEASHISAKASWRDILDRAKGGTVCLDRIDRSSPALLVELLRVLETSESARHPDVRFLSTTSKDLDIDIQAGAFRADVFFHLSGTSISIPPLRERVQEIIPLAEMFVTRAVERRLVEWRPDLTPEARDLLVQHSWPGNIRELRNVIERAVLVCSGPFIRRADLGLACHSSRASAFPPRVLATTPGDREPMTATAPLEPALSDERQISLEKRRILTALSQCNGNQTRAAKTLAMPRRTLVAKLVRYDIPRPRKTNPG